MNLIRDLVPQRLPVFLPVLMSFDEIGPVLLPGQPCRALLVLGSISLCKACLSVLALILDAPQNTPQNTCSWRARQQILIFEQAQ